MLKRFAILCLLICMYFALPARAAGPMGHYLIGRQLINNIQSGNCQVDAELKSILKHADAQRAFEGGCVGPDIAEQQSHYNDTAKLAANMLNDARQNYKAAALSKDQNALDKARQELAFAYGWYSHCASDLNIHPKVNAVVGDTYRYNSSAQKLVHAAQEAQLTAYLKSLKGSKPYDIYVPFDFLAKHVGLSASDLKAAEAKLRAKVIAENFASAKVQVTEKIAANWRAAVNGSLRQSEMFLANPNAMQNWDLDCGQITTAEFDQLRSQAILANGGSLPADWGKSYLNWYKQTMGLSKEKQLEALKSLVKKGPVTAVSTKPRANIKPKYGWVLTDTKEYSVTDNTYSNTGSNGSYTLQWQSHGCYSQGCPGETLSVMYTCSAPPKIIASDETISLDLTGTIAQNTMQHYSCNTSMDVFFDRPDIEPGSYGGGPGLGGLKIGGKDKVAPPKITVKGSPGKGYESAGKLALIVAMYNGRNAGTRYTYQWQELPSK